ncbi:MAG: sugar phosphate isomerase/epimerase, partial [Anaerolineae bacterium]|nr:sugar phosphate isomerase/epimerase [Anaerolineae bacterium]
GAWTRLRESLTAICTFAAHYGMRIAIEPADRYETDLMNTTGDALRMIDDLGFENLGVLFDTGHALVVGESTPKAIRTLGDRLFHVHVDDNQGQRDQHLAPGEGLVDFDAFLDALDGIGYEGFLCAELGWDYTIDPDPPARETAAFLRARLAAR